MPKSPSRASSRATPELELRDEIEAQILKNIEENPQLCEVLNSVCGKGRKKMPQSVNDLAEEYNCTAAVLKKAWQQARQKEAARKMNEKTEARASSTRSSSIEPRETRRSLRCQSSLDQTISAAASIVDSTDNSCVSSVCGSPKMETQRRASRRNLQPINEDANRNSSPASTATETAVVASTADSIEQPKKKQQKKQKKQKQAAAEKEEQQQQEKEEKQEEEVVQIEDDVSESSPADHRQPADSTTLLDDTDQTGALRKYLETTLPTDQDKSMRTLRFSESAMTTPCSKLHNSVNAGNSCSRRVSSRLPISQSKEPAAKLPINPKDATRLFFESIGITVANFPLHEQATVKAQVSKMVHELEYQLSFPDGGVDDKPTTAVTA